ncbi:MAG: Ig-like domain-containing protein [Cyclobacteriaceae bacterium]|nr:Ig-like domain-containing protein [Cyclobacteriaceae bacterium]
MRTIHASLFACLVGLLQFGGQVKAQVLPSDSLALVALYNATNGANWTNRTNWLTGRVGTWYGITVSRGRVTQINMNPVNPPFSGNNLTGTLPTTLGSLTGLTSLDLAYNKISGPIPPQLGNLTSLIFLNLSNAQLSGTIPAELGNLNNLLVLLLNNNQLSGTIPSQLGNLLQVNQINLTFNQLSGTIGTLTNLVFLRLNQNGFIGSLPFSIGNLNKLQELLLNDNQLSGDVPSGLGTVTTLINFQLQNNNISGLPPLSRSTLRRLNVANNLLTFEDIEPNIGIEFFTYSPQKPVPPGETQTIIVGNPFTRSFTIGGTANQYQWRKNGTLINGATSNLFTIPSVSLTDAGTFVLFTTNTLVPGLTLQTEPTILNVIGIPVTGITLSPTTLILSVGGATGTLTATISPANASNKAVTWTSSNPSIASVTNGVLSPLSGGTTIITARTVDGGFTATATVTVTVPVTGINLTPGSLTLVAGGAVGTLTAQVLPVNATNQSVTWSTTNPLVATVSNGVVTPLTTGTVTITTTTVDGGFSAASIVNVVIPVSGITVQPTTLTLPLGANPATIQATVLPANATNKLVNWSSSNPSVATVNNGVVTPVSVGNTVITARTAEGGFTATTTVAVVIPVTGISVSPASLTLIAGGDTGILTATVFPANATNKTVTWNSSSPSIATVINGIVTPVAPGSVLITATTVEGNFAASAVVNVIMPVTGITLTPASLTLAEGGSTGILSATVLPTNASNKIVNWSSSNTTVATVANGIVTPLSKGNCIITAITADGGFSATSTITVTGMPVLNTSAGGVNQPDGSTISFGTTEVGKERTRNLEVANTGTAALVFTNVLITGDFILLSAIPRQINEGASETLTIRFSPTALGSRRGQLTFLTNGNIPVYTLNLLGEGEAELEIFNVVSTNPNGKHDFLNIRNIWLYPDNRIQIFDRWGNPVYDQEGYDNNTRKFTGMSDNGRELPEGTYYYVLSKDKVSQPLTGYIFLRRN